MSPFLAPKVKPVGQEVDNPDEVLDKIIAAAKANAARLQQGSMRAVLTFTAFDERGKHKAPITVEAFAAYKPGKLRLDYKRDKAPWHSSFVTADGYHSHSAPRDRNGYLRDHRAGEMIGPYSRFVPDRNMAFGARGLEAATRKSGKALVCRVAKATLNGTDVYVVTYVSKKHPKNLFRRYVDPKRGCAVVRYESQHDFGKGDVLLREDQYEMQAVGGKRLVSEALFREGLQAGREP